MSLLSRSSRPKHANEQIPDDFGRAPDGFDAYRSVAGNERSEGDVSAPRSFRRRASDKRKPVVDDVVTPAPAAASDVSDATKERRTFVRPTLPLPRKARSAPSEGAITAPAKRKKSILQMELTPKKVKREEVMVFARQMASFVRAGIPVIDALAIVAEDCQDAKLKEILSEVTSSLKDGSSLTSALEQFSASFPRYFLSMIRSAEYTGRLDEVLDQIARYIDRDVETRRKVKSAMTYPSVIFVMAIGTVFVLSMFVLPKFVDFFKSFDAELPWSTKLLIRIADFMGTWGFFLVLVMAWLMMFVGLVTQRERGKFWRDRVVLATPKVGALLRTASIERFCRILSVLVRAGVPLPDALSVASDTTGNRVYRRAIGRIRTSIIRGSGLYAPVNESGLFPSAARQMIRVGENTGTLEDQLVGAAEFYGRELEYRLKRFTDLFEPAIVAFMGVVVGFVAYALVSAMYGVFNQVNPT
jgi:type IV pilus assembly protein PilC